MSFAHFLLYFYISKSVTALKTIPLIHTYRQEAYILTWTGVERWSKLVLRVVFGVFVYLLSFYK